jgi:peptide-methionine (R)-S-oxide reductase
MSVQKSEDEWRAVLSPEQFRILRKKGTEVTCPRETKEVHSLQPQ